MRHAQSLVVCCAIALAATAQAQSLDGPYPTGASDPYLQGTAYGGAAAQPSSARGIFLGTIAALIAQGVGTGIGTALAHGLGGSITKWFSGAPGPGKKYAQPARMQQPKNDLDEHGNLQAGIAYEVNAIGRDGTQAVNPARHVFRTGDRFQVFYRTTLPGRVSVVNVDPRGNQSRIDAVDVAAGQLAVLGPYQFVDGKGTETLKLLIEPCSSPLLTAATRRIVKAGAASAAADSALRIAPCGNATPRDRRSKSRSIQKASVEGSTVFALDPLSGDEISSGRVQAREIRISLQHR
jgi:hypothetical protein